MNDFITVYEYSTSQSDSFWLIGLVFVVFSGIWILANYRIHDTIFNSKSVFGLMLFAFSLIWTVSAYSNQSDAEQIALHALRNEKYKRVEGIIEDFDPMPSGGHKYESFTVAGVPFSYSDYSAVEGFNKTRSHGGPIRGDRDSVRIKYYTHHQQNFILKLEIKYAPDSLLK
ncbi:hypothetical protein [Pontibacter fetidus]|uniref:Uncharacterized protein n=1 Tax=Pontibacter fetidus TaxID=2700082 RepID=A0A6B2H6A3_9BACT|nr:hypothetical protein [Pontibacter fetidus]NDK54604.1 hypothetical protein [Pontibacter fetidus]